MASSCGSSSGTAFPKHTLAAALATEGIPLPSPGGCRAHPCRSDAVHRPRRRARGAPPAGRTRPLVPEIRSIELGLDTVGSPVSFHLCMITRHEDEAGLSAYQNHPRHLELASWLRPRLAERAVVDHAGSDAG
ncbi:Dabb family protein [Streptomyces sp. NBC_01022]|uniref:Dabb family protein n=1 Tax=Streptomyces sp. NBC_01022 TaxID=2903723 RepID=UPI002DD9340B|nr:Dabb family protein [Streptomyces sp. NBC_01022]WRZ87423.1 Dabb family protein [Streptomyces sp. NBC_01022]